MNELLGQQLSNYKLTRLLYRGAFTDTYLGEHVRMRAIASIVVLRANLTEDQANTFQEMAQRIAGLIYPHIVRTLDCDLYNGIPFLVQEYFPSSLRQLYPEGTGLPLSVVVTYVKQAASALQYAHDQGIIHGDLRPEQMLLRERDKSLLINGFGLTTLLPIFFPNYVPDNPYLASELPQQAPQPASDQYSLAAIAYGWLSGSSSVVQNEVEQVLNTARAREPAQRFATIRAFATALEQASKCGMEQPDQPPVLPAPITSAIAAPAIPDPTILQPGPPSSSQENASPPPPAEVSQGEPVALPQIPARRGGISRRRLLTGLAVGGVVLGGAVVAGIGGGVLPRQRQHSDVGLPSPPKLIYTYQSQSLYSDLISNDFDFFWSPDSTRIAIIDYNSLTLQVWDAADGSHLITWTAPKNSVCTFQWSQKSLLAAWSVGKGQHHTEEIIHVRDIINGHDMTTYTGHVSRSPGFGVRDITFSPDGKRIASLKDGYTSSDTYLVHVWDAMMGTTICSIAVDARTVRLNWSPDGKRLLSLDDFDSTLSVWDAQTGASETSITTATTSPMFSITPAWSPDSQYIASTGQDSGVVNVWNAHNGQRVCSYQHQAKHDVYSFAWSPDSAMIASACEGDNSIHVWNATTGKLIFAHGDWLFTHIAWSPDSKHIASKGPYDVKNAHSFQVWDAASGANSITYNTPASSFPSAGQIEWSPDGRLIAAVDEGDSNNNAIYVWRVGWGQANQQKA